MSHTHFQQLSSPLASEVASSEVSANAEVKFAPLAVQVNECGETEYWIEMLVGSNAISEQTSKELLQECGVIRRMLVKSITTAKGEQQCDL